MLAVLLGIVGASPLLIWNLRHGWASAHLNPGAQFPYYWRLRIFFSPILPEDLGVKYVDTKHWLVALPVGILLYAGLLVLFAYGAVRTRRRDVSLIYLTAAAFPFLYALSPKAIVSSEPRYALALAPCLALMAGHAASTYRTAALVLGAALALSAIGLHEAAGSRSKNLDVGIYPTSPRSVEPVIAELDRLRLTHVFTNYWLAYRLDFDSGERIVAVENGFDRLVPAHGDLVPPFDPKVHWQPYQRAVRAAPHGFVFFTRFPPPHGVVRTLRAYGYTRHAISRFVVYAPPVRAGTAAGT